MSGFVRHSEQSKAKIAAALSGRPHTKAHKKAIAEGWKRRRVNGGEAPHGTPARYKNAHCRCDECRAAWHDYKRARKAARS
jgi:hypothetical protein